MKTEINGITLAYDILGQRGAPVVLLHGFGLNRKIWLPVVTEYLRNQKVILPDLRGHGESEAPDGPYPMSLLAEDVVNLLAYLGLEKAIICGHSMGGYVTLAVASHSSQSLSGMGLITTRAGADTKAGRAGRYEMVARVKQQGAGVLAESLGPRLTKDDQLIQEMRAMLAKTSPAGIIGSLQGMAARPDRRDLLEKITVPALVVAGGQDQMIDLEQANQMSEALPDGTLLKIPTAGHLPMLEAPDALGKGLLTLVQRVQARQGQV